jgi:hypothetical protein
MQHEAWGLDRVGGDGHDARPLAARDAAALAHVADARRPAVGRVELDANGGAVGADLDAVGKRVGKMSHVGTGLGVDLLVDVLRA